MLQRLILPRRSSGMQAVKTLCIAWKTGTKKKGAAILPDGDGWKAFFLPVISKMPALKKMLDFNRQSIMLLSPIIVICRTWILKAG